MKGIFNSPSEWRLLPGSELDKLLEKPVKSSKNQENNQGEGVKQKEKKETTFYRKMFNYGLATVAVFLMPSGKEIKPGEVERATASGERDYSGESGLQDAVVIIDAGHGGVDPGSSAVFNGKPVYEAPYTLDVAERLQILVEKEGGVALMTHTDKESPFPTDEESSSDILPRVEQDRFTSNGKVVVARKEGMKERIKVVKKAQKLYPDKRVIFIAIHFDSHPSKNLKGMSVIVPADNENIGDGFGDALKQSHREREFKKDGSWQTYHPVVKNGVARNLYILDSKNNPAYDKALVELGNFQNKDDLYRIRNAEVRQEYAEVILQGIRNTLE